MHDDVNIAEFRVDVYVHDLKVFLQGLFFTSIISCGYVKCSMETRATFCVAESGDVVSLLYGFVVM
jgi:hypothetical protein